MKIARQLKDQNVCEYLLYMWQIEDTIRAMGCDVDRLRTEYVAAFKLPAEEEKAEVEWFENLIRMMHEEGHIERGK